LHKNKRQEVFQEYIENGSILNHPKFGAFQVLAITWKFGCLNHSGYMSNILNKWDSKVSDVYVSEIFSLVALVRYVYQFKECLSLDNLKTIEKSLERKRDYFSHGTINHAIMQASSWYLMAQMFPNVVWTNSNNEKLSSREISERLKYKISNRLVSFNKNGFVEQLSTTYFMLNFIPLLNIIDFSEDKNFKELVNDAANNHLYFLRLHSFDGIIVAPYARGNYQQTSSGINSANIPPAVSQQLLWLYFGSLSLGKSDFFNNNEPLYLVLPVLSRWEPNLSDIEFRKPYQVTSITPGFSYWGDKTDFEIVGRSSYFDGFAMGLGNFNFDPRSFNHDSQQFSIVLKSEKLLNQIECYHPYWRSGLGENAWARDRSSPFVQGAVDWNRAVIFFDIPEKDPWVYSKDNVYFSYRVDRASSLFKFFQCRIPKDFDQVVIKNGSIYIREGSVFGLIYSLGGRWSMSDVFFEDNLDGYIVLKDYRSRGGVFFLLYESETGENFSDFIVEAEKLVPDYSLGDLSVRWVNIFNKNVFVRFRDEYPAAGSRFKSIPDFKVDGHVVHDQFDGYYKVQEGNK